MRHATRLALVLVPLAAAAAPGDARVEATAFLDLYNSLLIGQTTVASEASWAASTDVSEANDGKRTAAGQAYAAFVGDKEIILRARGLLERGDALGEIERRQLQQVLLEAGGYPGTIPEVVNARVEAESKQASIQDGYTFCLERKGTDCVKPATANDIDARLKASKDLAERLKVWNASKEIGRPLKPGLIELQRLRNRVAREMGYSSFFGLQVADYGMTVDEMLALLDGFVNDTQPIYDELHTWTKGELAKRYGATPPDGPIPAHWFTNRWAQNWVGIVEGVDLDPYFKDRTPEWIVSQAERFYTSMGFPPLPKVFWEKSDLYPVPSGSKRKKNSHASAWHMNLGSDVRSLMSVEPNARWFGTAHHELGHVYYYLSYTRPEVPPTLREGANRAFHEGIGELITIAAGQVPYLQQQKILPKGVKINETQFLLSEALEHTLTFIPWSAGTITRFEYELYEKNLPPDQWQKRWWELAEKYQRVSVPSPDRLTDPTACDACTKTHLNDDPAQYYDYAIATVLKYQLHEHIAKKILKADPHRCNYYGNKEVGTFLRKILEQGATRDWRVVLKEATGEELSTRAMMEFFKPLKAWLEKENRHAGGGKGGPAN